MSAPREIRVQRRDGKRFESLRSIAMGSEPGVRVVHGRLRGSGIDAAQSVVVLAGSIEEARQTADRFWELSMDTPLLESSAMVCETVDVAGGLIKGVKIVGLTADVKGRDYSAKALRDAVPLYEGKSVNLNHIKPGEARKVEDRFGRLQNVRFVEGKGNFGDLRFNPEHPRAKQIAWFAKEMPEQLGLSHHSFGVCRRVGDREVVESIRTVKCIDLVEDPATTKGLFEDNNELSASALAIIGDDSIATADKVRRIARLLEGSVTTEPDPKAKDKRMDPKDITIEMLESRSDLVGVIANRVKAELEKDNKTTELKEENETLKKRLDELEVKNKLADKKARVEKLLKESKLPEAAVTDTFRQLLEGAADEAAEKALIEDRVKIAGRAQTPKSREQTLQESTGRKDGEKIDLDEAAHMLGGRR